ncbi:MAG TPA: M67 family metallopeptidase [Egibacteraceae bacterium]|nr:M67 family metallopeptidase [Egibacteraceae bacterium]
MTRAQIEGRLDLDTETYQALVDHARSDFPFEVCGLLAAHEGRLAKHFEIPNAARSMTYYNMDPKAMLHAMNEIDDQGWDLLAIYHSHTHTEAFPSATDVELAFYPDAVYLIVSLQDAESPVIRGFDIVDGRITERAVYVDGSQAPVGNR